MPANAASRETRKLLKRMPWMLLLVVAALIGIGLAFIYSASTSFAGAFVSSVDGAMGKQLGFLVASLLVAAAVACLDYRRLAALGWVVYAFGIALLLVCMVIGKEINGAKSWIIVGPLSLQVSELCKLCFIVTLAAFLRFRKRVEEPSTMFLPLVAMGGMLLLILKQPDFGTAMVFVPVFFVMLWCSGARLRFLLPLILAGAALMPALYFAGLFKDHQVKRIDTYVASLTGAPMDRSGDGYHITMSMNAIGSGGLSGKGYGEGTLSQFDYLPERHTDFIFSVIAEETGFFGALALVGLYFVMLVLCLAIALREKDPMGRLLVIGVVTMLSAQFIINVGMTCGVMPVTGIPLPFVSYGGSSLLTSAIAIGLVASVCLHPSRSVRSSVSQ